MDRMIFVNLAISDLQASRDFYTGLGFAVNEEFCDDSCACIVISDTIFVMLLARRRFAEYVRGGVGNPLESTSVINCISAETREEVDALTAKAFSSGGSAVRPRIEDGPMYGHSFADPDGHVWEVLHMDLTGVAAM